MKKLLLLFFTFSIVAISNLFAQTLTIDSSKSVLFPSTCDSGFYQSLTFNVLYSGPVQYNDTIFINYRVKNSKTNLSSAVITDTLVGRLESADSVLISASLLINTTNGFFVDSVEDIVVIWPTGSGGIALAGDSIIVGVHVITPTAGIKPITGNSFTIALYPNPAQNLLYFNYDVTAINIQQVRISNLLGQTILVNNSFINPIDVSSLPDGLYLLEAVAGKNRYNTHFVKTR